MNTSSDSKAVFLSQGLEDLAVLKNDEQIILPVLQEEVEIEKYQRVTGTVRLRKTVQEHEEVVSESLLSEAVEVERVPINRVVQGPIATRYEGQTTIFSVVEEVLVVSKQLVLKEEIRITKNITETPYSQQVVLRSEQIEVDRSHDSE